MRDLKRIMLAVTILTTAAAIVPANAALRHSNTNAKALAIANAKELAATNARMLAISPGATIRIGDACWQQTDAGRGYGFWTSCDNTVSFARAASEYSGTGLTSTNGGGSEGGGGGEGGGGEGGGGGD